MEKYVVEGVWRMGYYEEGVKGMKVGYGGMIESGVRRVWEGWGMGREGLGGGR